MKKKFIAKSVVLLLVAIIVLSLLFYKEILNFLIHLDISNSNFMVIYVAGCFLYFFTPLPTTLIIILNGYFFKSIGFYLSLLLVFHIYTGAAGDCIENIKSNKDLINKLSTIIKLFFKY